MIEMPLKHVYFIWRRPQLVGLWLANNASCVNCVRSPLQTAKVIIANTHLTDRLEIRMMVSSAMGKSHRFEIM